jgi:ribosomal protein S12 methylthiotransferase
VLYPRDISYYILSLGCSKNLVDSEIVNGAMESAGFVRAAGSDEADLIVINTCGFIQDAKEESLSVIFDAIDLLGDRGGSSGGPIKRRLAVAGCLTQRYRSEIEKDIPEIDFVYGLLDEGFVPALCAALNICLEGVDACSARRRAITPGLAYSYVKIAEGCSNKCSYCAIPLIRGSHRSFDQSFIMQQAREAVSAGARELDIVAQDIGVYRHGDLDLSGLVDMISRIGGVAWIRLLYCHPDHCDDSIIALLKSNEKVVPYIDLPFQHVSARILRSMGRTGDARSYGALVERLRREVPDIRIRSTFMVGYPGESDQEYRELLSFLQSMRLDRVGAFSYSPEEDTAAALLADRVPERVKARRLSRLMALQQEISREKLQGMIGQTLPVLVEERLDDGTFMGRSCYDAPEVDGIFYLTGNVPEINTIVRARVTDAAEYDLFGIAL